MVGRARTSSSRPSAPTCRPGRALDLAAGEGRNAIWLARRGWDVTAVDFSQVALDKGARTLAGDTDVDVGLRRRDDLAGAGTYDLVVVAYLQLPADERRAAARASGGRRCGPAGTFLLVGHDSTNLTEGTGGPQDPRVLITADDVLADLDGYGRRGRPRRAGRARWQPRETATTSTAASRRTAWDCLVRSPHLTAVGIARPPSRSICRVARSVRRSAREWSSPSSAWPRRSTTDSARVGDRLVAVDAGVLGGLRLAQLLDQAEAEEHDGRDEQQEDHEGDPAGLDVLGLGALLGDRAISAGRCISSMPPLSQAGAVSPASGCRRTGRPPGSGASTWLTDQLEVLGRPHVGLDLPRDREPAAVGVDLGRVRQQRLVAHPEVVGARHPGGDPGVPLGLRLPLLEPLRPGRLEAVGAASRRGAPASAAG